MFCSSHFIIATNNSVSPLVPVQRARQHAADSLRSVSNFSCWFALHSDEICVNLARTLSPNLLRTAHRFSRVRSTQEFLLPCNVAGGRIFVGRFSGSLAANFATVRYCPCWPGNSRRSSPAEVSFADFPFLIACEAADSARLRFIQNWPRRLCRLLTPAGQRS